jgi:chromosome segregation protein
MRGFKSFADRTELVFVPGVTAVVGPNGSGKSNVTDGIRWVLGEQSAKSLRGSKMEDVIFAGSDSRKPVGVCEVSLVLDNSERRLKIDFAEVRITRRVNRSGESEYFLNQKPCRLKDITELFMDTGIGKEAYSMIGQGRIDDILSTKSEDRRAIFEEAAGIVKYKVRKKEAEKKLEQTEQNLTRIYDLIHELESQVAPLEEQAEKATRYKELKQELEKVEVGLYVYKIETLHRDWLEISEEVKKLTQRQVALSTLISKREAELEEYKCLQMEHDQQFEQVQAELLKVSEDLEKTEGLREVQLERNRSCLQAQGQLQERIELFKQDLARLQEEKKQLTDRLVEKQTNLKEVEASIQMIQEQLRLLVDDEQKQLDDEIARLQQLKNRQIILQSEQNYTIQSIEQVTKQIGQFESEKKLVQEKLKEEREQQLGVKQQLAETAQLINQLTVQLAQLRKQQQQDEEIERQLRKQQKREEQIYHRLCSQRDVLQEMEKKHTGFLQGVKSILTARDRGVASLQKIHGAVAQLLVVPEKYEAALETALGGALQYLVVEDEQTARQGIAYLKEKSLGRATFLPLDVIKGRKISPNEIQQLQNMPGFLGVAADLVEAAPQYAALVSYLLGMVIVAETLEQANQIARKLQYRYRVVTLDGDIVNAGGSMTGGSRQSSKSNLLGRSRQLESLEKQVMEQKERLEKLNNQLWEAEEKKRETQSELEEFRQKLEKSRLQEQALLGEQREREKQIQQMEKNAEQLGRTQQEANRRLVELEKKKEEQAKQNDQLEQEIPFLLSRLRSAKNRSRNKKQSRKRPINS